MVLHNAHVVDYLQSAMHWNDASLGADHWFSMPVVAPTVAAMLLCQHNPDETTFDDAARCTNDETGPCDLKQLQQQFEALNTVAPSDRTLRDWKNIAGSKGLKYHSWIDGYMEATAPLVADAATNMPMAGVALDDEAWKTRARESAAEIIKRQREKDLYPSQENLGDEIARKFRTDGIVGADGKPLSGAYIKRHALKG